MDSKQLTISSLTSEPDDLTFIHAQSDLPTIHETHRTQEGFLIEPSRLPNCVPLPATNKGQRSWVWDHGIAIGKANEDQQIQRYWLCKICYNGTVIHPLTHYLIPCPKGTTKAIDHLQR
jgi:hypothetical protein